MPTVADIKEKLARDAESGDDEAPKKRGRKPLTPEQRAENERQRKAEEEAEQQQRSHVDAMLTAAIGQLADAIVIRYELPPRLDEQEKMLLAEGSKPLIYKYLPDILDKVGPELIFGCTLWFIYGKRWMDKKARESEARSGNRKNGTREEPSIQADFERVPPTPGS